MTLAPGRELSHYRLVERIGEGGMGVVWRADDTTLGRAVAIKVLPAAFADDPERMARFEREARLLASLNHPAIASIYGVGTADGVRFLAMELVEGQDLAARLAHGPLPLGETLERMRGIAEGLEAAHEKGVIHRDLKPANVKLTVDGKVKLLDFGLAKALDPEPDGSGAGSGAGSNSISPTITSPMTAFNVILGTAAYMSPEQARGKPVDRRADIWAFGAVLYECLAGRRAFPGDTVSETIAKVLERDPDWSALPASTPARVRELMRRCLEKDPRRRLRDIGDARLELDELLAGGTSDSAILTRARATDAIVAPAPARPGTARAAWAVAGAAVLVAALALAFPGWVHRAPRGVTTRAMILAPPGMQISPNSDDAVLSPDGTTLVFVAYDSTGKGSLWLRPVDSYDTHPIAGSDVFGVDSPALPFWSPDGRTIGFFANDKLETIPLNGGQPQVLATVTNGRGASWSRDGVILVAATSQGPIYRIPATGGDPVPVTTLDSTRQERAHRFPQFLPDGRHFLFAAVTSSISHCDTWIGELGSRERKLLLTTESGVAFVPPNAIVYRRGSALMVQRFDPGSRRVTGEAVRVADAQAPLMLGSPMATGTANGVMVFPSNVPNRNHLYWYERDGRPLGELHVPPADYTGIAISHDQRRVVLAREESVGSTDLWLADANTGALSRLTTDGEEKFGPLWMGDDDRVFYGVLSGSATTAASAPHMLSVSGAPFTSPLYPFGSVFKSVSQVTRDGSMLVFDDLSRTTQRDLWIASLTGDHRVWCYLQTPFNESSGQRSPDGHWMAYQSDESGRPEIYVQSFPTPGHKVRVSTDGGTAPVWREDGGEILYAGVQGPMAALVKPGPELGVTPARLLFGFPSRSNGADMTPDSKRFLISIAEDDARKSSLTLLANWQALLQK